jgi:hypothetical protein
MGVYTNHPNKEISMQPNIMARDIMVLSWGLCSVMACRPTHTDPDATITTTEEQEPIPQSSLHGNIVSDTILPPDFVAYNHDNTARNKDNFMGHPTVIWFYPFANTPG